MVGYLIGIILLGSVIYYAVSIIVGIVHHGFGVNNVLFPHIMLMVACLIYAFLTVLLSMGMPLMVVESYPLHKAWKESIRITAHYWDRAFMVYFLVGLVTLAIMMPTFMASLTGWELYTHILVRSAIGALLMPLLISFTLFVDRKSVV